MKYRKINEVFEDLVIVDEEDLYNSCDVEPVDFNEIINKKHSLEKEVFLLGNNLNKFYDNVNLLKISQLELKKFLIKRYLKTKKDLFIYCLEIMMRLLNNRF